MKISEKDRRLLDSSYEISTGCMTIDVIMAQRHGWSDAQILRAQKKMHAVSVRESNIAHRNAVKNCPCETCDKRTATALLTPEAKKRRRQWMKKGLWP